MSHLAGGQLRCEIDHRPLFTKAGQVLVSGWCVDEKTGETPSVRLATDFGILPVTKRIYRHDVAQLFPNHAQSSTAGFEIEGRLPAGVYLVRLEALLTDGAWTCLRTFSLAVERPAFAAVIDEPIATGVLHDRVRVGGWASQTDESISEISLRYGHRELACELGGQRADLSQISEADHSPALVFKSREHLVAGHGPVRIRARLAGGQTVVSPTPLIFSIKTDENHGPELDLTAKRIGLPAGNAPVDGPSSPAIRPLNVLFILYGSFASNSALHVAALANELAGAGHTCTVAVPHDLETLDYHKTPGFRGITHAQAEQSVVFPDGRGPDIIHAWTTRENVRNLSEKIRSRHNAPLVVHLEDNEQHILALNLGLSVTELESLCDQELARLVPTDLSNPRRGRDFLSAADAITVITDRLREWVPVGKPCLNLVPAADSRYFFPRPIPAEFRQILDVTPDCTVLFYHGNVHAANAAEMRELYSAVIQLNRTGQSVTLIRTGLDRVDFLGAMAAEIAPYVLNLGQISHHRHLPALMALANIFVQPGQPDPFNDYRFPSKLPEFFAIGRPVVVPRTNLGELLRHGIDAYVLDRADAPSIVRAVAELRANPALSRQLAAGALAFAASHFSWRRTAETLAKFYASLTA